MSKHKIADKHESKQHSDQELAELLGDTDELILPEDLIKSSSWRRAQSSHFIRGSVSKGRYRISLPQLNGEMGGNYHVTFCMKGSEQDYLSLLADCSCKGFEYHNICCHVLHCYWQFCRSNLLVYNIDQQQYHDSLPEDLLIKQADQLEDLSQSDKRELAESLLPDANTKQVVKADGGKQSVAKHHENWRQHEDHTGVQEL